MDKIQAFRKFKLSSVQSDERKGQHVGRLAREEDDGILSNPSLFTITTIVSYVSFKNLAGA